MNELLQLDKELFIFLNGFHADWLDPIMLFITHTRTWIPLYIFLAYLIVRDFKKSSWMPFLGIALAILLADQITSHVMKPYFERLRPSHEPSLKDIVHIVQEYRGGKYGFASSHAANTMATATFFFLLFGKKKKWIWLLFMWAALMTYSRIYLGVHYPGDIVVGTFVGILCAWLGYTLFSKLKQRQQNHPPYPREEGING
jgi:undecaprenyl-diphosphatase